MFELLKGVYQKIESIRGKNLIITISIIFVVFTVMGILLGYSIQAGLIENEMNPPEQDNNIPAVAVLESYTGRIEYVNPNVYEGVTHVLVNKAGEDYLLLVADDEKLSLSEGLFVTVRGPRTRTSEKYDHGLDTLNVQEVIISNASN